jgi:hypothetical protein
MENLWVFVLLLPVISFFYASVGHGGASGYLALMALFSFAPEVMKPTALLLNIFVAGISFYFFYKSGYFNKKLFLYFAVSSIPLAYFGGTLQIDASLYKKILAFFLVIAIIKMLGGFGKIKERKNEIKIPLALLIGGVIGFFSGLIGIGGGIILTPVILLLHWGNVKEAAAVSALFIWVNSVAGLVGQIQQGVVLEKSMFYWVIIAILGGIVGGYYGSKMGSPKKLKLLLAVVLIIASIKLVLT